MIVFFVGAAEATTLDEAWAAAEEADLQVRLAEETAIQQETLRGKAWSALSPRVSSHLSYIVNEQEIALDFADSLPPELAPLVGDTEPVVVQKKVFWQGDVTASARLFSGSALPALRAAYALTGAARGDLAAARSRSKASVAGAYYGLLTAERSVEVAAQGVVLAQAQERLATQRRDAGVGDERSVIQGHLGVSKAERDLQSAQEALAQARTGFEMLTGLTGEDLELPEPFPVPPDPGAAVAQARVERPDLQAAAERVRASRLSRTATDLGWLPTLDAVAAYNYTENTGLAAPKPWMWRVALQGTWDLWDGGYRLAASREAQSRTRQAEYAQELATQAVEREVALAFEAHARAEKALTAVDAERALANESLRLAELGYGAGEATALEVEQARLLVQATELAFLRERMNRDLAAIQLLERTGRL